MRELERERERERKRDSVPGCERPSKRTWEENRQNTPQFRERWGLNVVKVPYAKYGLQAASPGEGLKILVEN